MSERARQLTLELEQFDSLRRSVEERFRLARELIKKYGANGDADSDIVGYVSRVVPSRASGSKFEFVFDVPPERYLTSPISVGDLVATVNLSTLDVVLLEVTEVQRADVMAMATHPPLPAVPRLEPSGILTPAVVVAKPLLAMDVHGRVRVPAEPLEPQSPLFRPNAETVVRLFGLPETGVVLGCLVTLGGKVMVDVPVKFPLEAFYQHVLIIGTTGSGKTTFLKNMICALLSGVDFDVPQSMRPTIVVFDATGEYLQLLLPKPEWQQKFGIDLSEEEALASKLYSRVRRPKRAYVILPVPKKQFRHLYQRAKQMLGTEDPDRIAEKLGELLGERFLKEHFGVVVEALGGRILSYAVKVDVEEDELRRKVISRVTLKFEAEMRGERFSAELVIIPWALVFNKLRERVKDLSPVFTQQARAFLKSLLESLEKILRVPILTLRAVRNAVSEHRERLERMLDIHRETLKNIARALTLLDESGLFDVMEKAVVVSEPSDYGQLMVEARGELVIVDLRQVEREEYLVVYRILKEIFRWKKRAYEEGRLTHPVICVIDEAHRYFPAAGFASERESILMIESMLRVICRLGRMRGLGIVFATHSPDDVSSIVLQLTNTKIAFRTEEKLLEKLHIPAEYRRLLTIAPDRLGLIRSHVFRTHYVLFKTCLPLAGHYDVSALTLQRQRGEAGSSQSKAVRSG